MTRRAWAARAVLAAASAFACAAAPEAPPPVFPQLAFAEAHTSAGGPDPGEWSGVLSARVSVKKDVSGELLSARLVHWRAGARTEAETRPVPVLPLGTLVAELPGSEAWPLCEAHYYAWSVTWRPGPRLAPETVTSRVARVQRTQRRGPDGALVGARCAAPPGPEA